MRFLFKIYSGYDGFRPAVIERRMDGGLVPLKWPVYFDDAEKGAEVWIYFHGPHKFENGVYIRGRIQRRDPLTSTIYLHPTEYSLKEPLSDPATSEEVAATVQTSRRQVFFFPPSLAPTPDCDLHARATTCLSRLCQDCDRWQQLPTIVDNSFRIPERIKKEPGLKFRAGVWVIPSRCYRRNASIPKGVQNTSNLFYRFKVGDEAIAFPLAALIDRAIRMDSDIDLDTINAIIPVPLSPNKVALKELHRTRALATQLGELTRIPVLDAVSLQESISKRRLIQDERWTMAQFEHRYRSLLQVVNEIANLRSVIVIDDVATRGSTLRCMVRALRTVNDELEILAVTAGQMILASTCRSLP